MAYLPSQQGSGRMPTFLFGEKAPETIRDTKDPLLGLQSGRCSDMKKWKYSLQKPQQLGRANTVKSVLFGNLMFYSTSGKDGVIYPHMDCYVVKLSADTQFQL